MLEQIKSRLDLIVGQSFNFQNKNVTIDSYKIVSGTNFIIFLSGRPRNFFISEVDEFLEELSPAVEGISFIPQRKVELPGNETTVIYETAATTQSKSLKESLIAMLEKIKVDPTIIPQAKAMVDVANAIVNIQKTELQAIELELRINKR